MGGEPVTYDGLSPSDLARRIRAPQCVVLAAVGSTLDVVHELAAQGAPAGTVVVADQQLAGRGREGRRWYSAPGRGVLVGYLHRPLEGGPVGVLALRVGLAVAEGLDSLGCPTQLKWPNDLMVGDRKAGGVLCEARSAPGSPGWVAVGVGLNVHGPVPVELADRAAALDDVRPGISRVAVLEAVVPRLHRLGRGAVLSDTEHAAYRRLDWLAGRMLESPLRGRALGVDREGALTVETARGPERVWAGSVVVAAGSGSREPPAVRTPVAGGDA